MLQIKSHVVADMGPSSGNPRNSEGAFLKLKDGRLLFAYSRFVGSSYADFSHSCIACRYSNDEGETWTETRDLFYPEEHGAINIMSVSLMRMINEDIGMFYLIRYTTDEMRLYLRRSSDEGKTWSEARPCMPEAGYYVVNNDRIIRLSSSGRLVIPASWHDSRGANGKACFFLSDDDGESWKRSQELCILTSKYTRSGLQEPGIIELRTGVLWAWARTDMGRQYEMFSTDQGENWSEPAPSRFTSPLSPMSVKRDHTSNQLLAIWNPIPQFPTRKFHKSTMGRFPFIGAVSGDEGENWGQPFVIELDEQRGYCYTAIHFTEDDSVLLAYCAGGEKDQSCLARLTIRKIKLSEICNRGTA